MPKVKKTGRGIIIIRRTHARWGDNKEISTYVGKPYLHDRTSDWSIWVNAYRHRQASLNLSWPYLHLVPVSVAQPHFGCSVWM